MSDDTTPDAATGDEEDASPPSREDFNAELVEQFRAEGGRLAFGPMQLVVVTHRGARSGAERTTPLAAFTEDGRLFVVASFGGAPKHPAWYHNLVTTPSVRVEFDGEVFAATARVLPDDERDALYPRIVAAAPQFGEYQEKTTRRIPVVELQRT
jgi:deazaflavin-dependent oxidoreductase (nitroreductase family)